MNCFSGVLKEEVVNSEASLYSSHIEPWSNNVTSEAIPKFAPIQSKVRNTLLLKI